MSAVSTLTGIATAGLALIALEVTVTGKNTTGLASLLAEPGKLAAAWMDPSVPLIPDKAGVTINQLNSKSIAQTVAGAVGPKANATGGGQAAAAGTLGGQIVSNAS